MDLGVHRRSNTPRRGLRAELSASVRARSLEGRSAYRELKSTESIGEIFGNLQQALDTKLGQKIRLAIHRLNLSSMRTTDEDGVIDAMIAMEALLSDGTQEMTHKVAMRLAGLCKLKGDSRCEQAFKEMKQIY